MRNLYILAFAIAAFVFLTPRIYADSAYSVQLTTPASDEWTEDPYGGIWNANVAQYPGNFPIVSSNALVMCSGDLHDIYIGQWTGPYAPTNLLSATPTQIASDPGNYSFPTLSGFTLANRTPDVQAKVAYLVDQMYNALVLPQNLQGHDADDWVECKGDALVGAIHNLWDGVTFTPEVESGDEAWETPAKQNYYSEYMSAVAGINAGNYTSSNSIWLVNPGSQVLFAELGPSYPPDPTTVPEPAILSAALGLLAVGGVTLLRRNRKLI